MFLGKFYIIEVILSYSSSMNLVYLIQVQHGDYYQNLKKYKFSFKFLIYVFLQQDCKFLKDTDH